MDVLENNFYTCNFIYGGGVQIMTEIQRGKNGIVGIYNRLKDGEEVRKDSPLVFFTAEEEYKRFLEELLKKF